MAGEKIYNNSDSSKELDKYGVWVKSDPYAFSESSVVPLVKNEDLLDDDFEIFEDTLEIADPLTEGFVEDFIMKDIEEAPDTTQQRNLETESMPLPREEVGFTPMVKPDPVLATDSLPKEESKPSVELKEPAVSDTSIQLLTKILEELSLIKEELSGFREAVLSSLSKEGAVAISPPEYVVPEAFEKIVLAGDELDGILNKADFIEDADMINGISADTADFMEREELSEEDLDFLKGDTFPNQAVLEGESLPNASMLPVEIGQESILEDPEKLQWLMKTGDKPLTEGIEEISKPSETEKPTLLIDDLLIESGSIKDMPIDLDLEEDEEGENFDVANLDTDDMSCFAQMPFIVENSKEPLDKIIFPDEYQDISDDELDKMEKEVLREFSNKLPVIEEIFFLEKNKNHTPNSSEEGKKKLKNVEQFKMPGVTIREELKTVLSYMDQLLEALPDTKIGEFAESVHFDTYRKLCNELGLSHRSLQ